MTSVDVLRLLAAALELVNSLVEGLDPTKADTTPRDLLKVGFAASLSSIVRAIARIAMPVTPEPSGECARESVPCRLSSIAMLL